MESSTFAWFAAAADEDDLASTRTSTTRHQDQDDVATTDRKHRTVLYFDPTLALGEFYRPTTTQGQRSRRRNSCLLYHSVGSQQPAWGFSEPRSGGQVLRINRRCNIGEIAAAFASLGSCGLVATLLPRESSRYFVPVISLAEGFRRLLPPRTH
jgi:hypothetical protein